MQLKVKAARVLDFDIENKPLTYLGHDFTTCEVTAIAASWDFPGNHHVSCWLLYAANKPNAISILERFRVEYDQADIVTGHYIRKHDLPIINGAMLEWGLAPLAPKLTIDTKLDLKPLSGVSKSQESLSAMLGIEFPKIHMTQADWREANRLSPEGLEKTRERVTGDVRQHKALRLALTERGLLRAPKVWSP